MVPEFCVDIWLLYGSFAYAFESEIFSWGEEELTLAIHTKSNEDADNIECFIEQVTEKPKGLLRVELRVYGPQRHLTRHGIRSPLYMYTEVIPHPLPRTGMSPLLNFKAIKALSPSDTQQWFKLVRQIWNQSLSPKNVQKR